MELELYSFVYCVKQWAPYLLGRRFTVRTDHKNLVFLSNSTIPKLVRWRVLLSEFQYQVEHIPGRCNFVADGLTRVSRLEYEKIKPEGRHLYRDDTISRIFRWEGEEVESCSEGIIDEVGTKYTKQDMFVKLYLPAYLCFLSRYCDLALCPFSRRFDPLI